MQMIITYTLLGLCVSSLWFRGSYYRQKSKLWMLILAVSMTASFIFGFIDYKSIPFIILFGGCCYLTEQENISGLKRVFATGAVCLLSLGFIGHYIPGFFNPAIIRDTIISKDAPGYSLYFSYDKALVGIFILGFARKKIFGKRQFLKMLSILFPILITTVIVLCIAAVVFGYTRFDLKFNKIFFVWTFSNLFITCLSEEAFFRGFVQKHLQRLLIKHKHGAVISLLSAAVLFGLVHYGGGVKYIILAVLAGIGYGFAYQKTTAIEASILTHFSVNLAHFIFFTYPVLTTALPFQ